MLSIGLVSSAGAASRYFDKDNYYGAGETSPSTWLGQGAEALGLSGPVNAKSFEAVLDGYVPGTEQRLGIPDKEGAGWKHQAGWDLTFSAPKSVTLLAMLGGDARIIAAHDHAVAKTIGMVERDYASTRLRKDGEVVQEKTESLTVAAFRHDLSRLQEPQLHTHAVVVNMTQGKDEKWRSLVSRDIYNDSKVIGVRYQQELAIELRNLGYEVEPKKNGTFEVRGISPDLIDAFSNRRADVVRWLEAHGIDPEKATQIETRRAALATRNNKIVDADRDGLRRDWEASATSAGLSNLAQVVNAALARGTADITPESRMSAADRLIQRAVETVSERQAAWTGEQVLKEAGRLAPGRATADDLKAGLRRLEDKGTIVPREVTLPDPKTGKDHTQDGLTRTQDKALEQRIVNAAFLRIDGQQIMRSSTTLLDRTMRQAARTGYAWNEGQREAARVLLETRDAVTGLQGLAGTAKTTTVLKAVAEAARKRGFTVSGLAPTASAADELGKAISAKGETVAKHLLTQNQTRGKQLWIVDEASMISARDMARLLEQSQRAEAKLILVGDVHQLGAVEAGAPFKQLQTAGMKTAVLERIVRQRSSEMRGAIQDAARGHVQSAVATFESAGGNVAEIKDEADRFKRMARDYVGLSKAQRADTIVIEPSIQGRARLNREIRDGLIRQGELGASRLQTNTLRRIGLSRAEAKETVSYVPGAIVRFRRGYRFQDGSVQKGEYLTVKSVLDEKHVTLKRADGRQVTWQPEVKGSRHVEVFERDRADLRAQDRIRWHENTDLDGKTIRNGQIGIVARVDAKHGTAILRFEGVGMAKLDVSKDTHRHWSHAYAETAHAAQGRTSERVMIHAESNRINLINHKSVYVALSRLRETGTIYTDDRTQLLKGAASRKSR